MIDSELIERARAIQIENVLDRHGVRLRGRIERTGPCPECGGQDRFSVNVKKQVFLCRQCDAKGGAIDLEMFLSGIDFQAAVASLAGGEWQASERRRGPTAHNHPDGSQRARQGDDEAARMSAVALGEWDAAVDPGTLVKRYLESRDLTLDADIARAVVRGHPGIGAMICLFRDIRTDEPKAISRTFIDNEGRKLSRKFLGRVGGCAIKLDADGEVLGGLHICEGVETGLAARQLGLRPTWALGSAGAIASFPILSGVECLTLMREHDDASARATEQCAARWHAAGRQVIINESTVGSDLNDAIRRARS